ncbi:hypothetical protein [Pectobacterium versatile]|uniref:hypothetical protein n=1 Tax=Pectobacterium versatile TaxID=2488639 RepID=UPI0030167F48
MLENIIEILNKDVILPLSNSATPDSSFVIVQEEGVYSEIKELTIKKIPDDSIAFTLDFSSKKSKKDKGAVFSQLSPYFDKANADGINKSCDLIIITRKNDKFIVLIFDQKSKKPDIDESFLQLENSRIFILYIINIISTIYKVVIKEENINFHRVIGTTRVTKTSLNAAKLDPEQLRRQDLRKLGMKEISIKRTESPEKGWLDFRGIITTC